MYFPYFISYMLLGAAISIPVFLWALKHDQFRHAERARFLPLEGDLEPAAALPASAAAHRFRRLETYVLITLVMLGLAASAAVVVFALIR